MALMITGVRPTGERPHTTRPRLGLDLGRTDGRSAAPSVVDLYEKSHGEPGQAPLIFLHGTGECAETFSNVASRLVDIRHVVSYDQRGTGRSSWVSDDPTGYKWSHFIYDLRTVSERNFGDQKSDLVGSSIGGIQALAFAAIYPDLVHSIVLLDTAPGALPNKIEVLRNMVAKRYNTQADARRELTSGYEQAELNALLQERNGTWGIHFDHALLNALPPSLFESAIEFAANVHCPVLVLRGAKSKVFSPKALSKFQEKLPKTTSLFVEDIPNAGHRIIKDNPGAFLEVTRKFFNLFPRLTSLSK